MDVQVAALTRKMVESAARDGEPIVVFDGDTPLSRITPMAGEMQANAPYFTHFPHDPSACFYTCWRHPRPALVSA